MRMRGALRAGGGAISATAIVLLVLLAPGGLPGALGKDDTAGRIQAKIAQAGAGAIKLREAGGDVSPIEVQMQNVSAKLQAGRIAEAEALLDTLLTSLGTPPAAATAALAEAKDCDPGKPMTVSGPLTITANCTVGGDLTLRGDAMLHFDYTGRAGGRLVVKGNVAVQDHATLWVEGGRGAPAIFAIDNDFSDQRSMASTDDSAIKLQHVVFQTRAAPDAGKGSVYMTYQARGHSSFEASGTSLEAQTGWLLAELHDRARLTVADSRHVPTEIYIQDKASTKISGAGTQTGVWLDAGGVKGVLKLPDMNAPFSWQVGASAGLDVGWALQVDDAQPGVGVQIKPGTTLTIIGNGARAAPTGEMKISYFVVGERETLDGLEAGVQNRKIGDRLTLQNVQLGPIAWQIYAGDDADLTIRNSTINEIGLFGRNAKVRVEHSILQLATLAVLAPGSVLDIRESEMWNQTVEAANQGRVSIADSRIYGTLFHIRDGESRISISGGSFKANPAGCTEGTMVNISTGQPRCNPFRTPGQPRFEGIGKAVCTNTQGCDWRP